MFFRTLHVRKSIDKEVKDVNVSWYKVAIQYNKKHIQI